MMNAPMYRASSSYVSPRVTRVVWGVAMAVIATMVVMLASSVHELLAWDKTDSVYQEEYGYAKVFVDDNRAAVVTTSGEGKSVNVMTYKGYMVLFEDKEHFDAKVAKVDNGTYPEELYFLPKMTG